MFFLELFLCGLQEIPGVEQCFFIVLFHCLFVLGLNEDHDVRQSFHFLLLIYLLFSRESHVFPIHTKNNYFDFWFTSLPV